MSRIFITIAAIALATTVSARGAQPQQSQQSTPPAQTQKPDQKAPPSVAGKWDMTIETDQGQMQAALEIKLDGKKVTGSINGPQGQYPIEGEFADNKLAFSVNVDSSGGAMQVAFSGTLKDDGSLSGSLDFGQGEVPWHAVRSKG